MIEFVFGGKIGLQRVAAFARDTGDHLWETMIGLRTDDHSTAADAP